jgi:pimeloyl-ACP methyl ester carboxylesterase
MLITGSGQQDRDEEVLGHRPFLLIADYLTRRGIVVLRVDDRGVGKTTGGKLAEATTEDFMEDALACIAFLRGRKEIAAKQIGLIGHSEGGLIAPMAAVRSPDVAFIVLLAGPGLPGDEINLLQGELELKAAKAPKEAFESQRRLQKGMIAVLKAEKNAAVAQKKIIEFLEREMARLPEKEKEEAAKQMGALAGQLKQLTSPWFRFFISYDPRPTLQKVNCPVLALNGERDMQVPPKENLPEIEKALRAGGNKDFTTKELPKLNHLFQHCQTGTVEEYTKIEETFDPKTLELIGDWIGARTKRE